VNRLALRVAEHPSSSDPKGAANVNSKPSRVVRPSEFAERAGVSRVTLWRWERAGRIPARRKIGPNTVGWLESELEQWLDSRPTVRDAPQEWTKAGGGVTS
jgi:prophage regulatory protein